MSSLGRMNGHEGGFIDGPNTPTCRDCGADISHWHLCHPRLNTAETRLARYLASVRELEALANAPDRRRFLPMRWRWLGLGLCLVWIHVAWRVPSDLSVWRYVIGAAGFTLAQVIFFGMDRSREEPTTRRDARMRALVEAWRRQSVADSRAPIAYDGDDPVLSGYADGRTIALNRCANELAAIIAADNREPETT